MIFNCINELYNAASYFIVALLFVLASTNKSSSSSFCCSFFVLADDNNDRSSSSMPPSNEVRCWDFDFGNGRADVLALMEDLRSDFLLRASRSSTFSSTLYNENEQF